MNKVHQKLKLQHHRHTGKLLHHRHTSYRGLALVFGLAALTIVGLNVMNRVAADSLISIYGTVPVPIPTSAAIIAVPEDGSTTPYAQTIVAGSCPLITPQVIVAIEVDGTPTGSAVCDSNNDFSLPLALSTGSHSLVARTYTITGEQGPASSPMHIAYAPRPGTAPVSSTALNPVVITATQPFSYLGAGRTATWTGSFMGPIHDIKIDWGDGSLASYSVQAGAQHFSHHYSSLGSYNTTFTLADTSGHFQREQFAVAAYRSSGSSSGIFANTIHNPPPIGTSTTLGLYGLFLTCLSVCGIVWIEAKHAARQQATVPISRQGHD